MTAKEQLKLNLVFAATTIVGLLTLGSTLLSLFRSRHLGLVLSDAHFTVLAGLSLIYLAVLLRRGKHNAWLISVGVYIFLFIRNIQHFVFDDDFITKKYIALGLSNLVLPLAALVALVLWRKAFKVRSSLTSFRLAAQRALLVLLIAFLYGVIGFQLLDHHDFRQQIPLSSAVHYTVDQFGLTTNDRPIPHTRRAVIFIDSLNVVSVASLFYVAVSFFAPIRFRLTHSQQDWEDAKAIFERHSTTSEDFFKLWPRDKDYFFNRTHSACIAYRVVRGVALGVGDPAGPKAEIKPLLESFKGYCYVNGWSPAFIHTEESLLPMYEALGFDVQKIGEEALVDTSNFSIKVAGNKYFRQIANRFSKAGFTVTTHDPPHEPQLLEALKRISDDWLKIPGRAERTFMLGYFSPAYMQLCKVLTVQDQAGKIWAFSNLVPSPLAGEATYDFIRHADGSPGNINDFLMMSLIIGLQEESVGRLNMGLSPLAGLHAKEGVDRSIVDNLLNLVYTKADRFYSFQGLTRFKKKYEPGWQSRYIVYTGGLAGFGKTMNALLKAMTR